MSYPPPYDHTTFRGITVDQRTSYLLGLVEKQQGYPLQALQGSYNAGGVRASAGTHDGGGAVDVWSQDVDKTVRVLRQFGFAAWHRLPSQGPWGQHIHAVECGNQHLADSAARQIAAYRDGLNGLANRAPDDGPRIKLVPRHYPPLPYVSLPNVVQQAMAGGARKLIGVQRIQQALNAQGFHVVEDGRFGPATRKAYALYEHQIGGNGDGVPGIFSLTKLGAGRYKVRKT